MVYLKYCEFKNCQSLKNVTYEFSPGLNVIIAPNNSGKSVFGKLNKLSGNPKAYSKDDRNDLITKGEQRLMVRYVFSDDSASILVVTQDKPPVYFYTENVYEIRPQAYTEPHPSHMEKMSFLFDESTGFYANILDIERTKFLSSGMNKESSSVLKLYSADERIEQALVILDERADEYSDLVEKLNIKSLTLQGELNAIPVTNIQKLMNKKNTLKVATEALRSLIEIVYIADRSEVVTDIAITKRNLAFLSLAEGLVKLLPNEIVPEQKVLSSDLLDSCLSLANVPNVSLIPFESVSQIKGLSDVEGLLGKLSFINTFRLETVSPVLIKSEITALLDMSDLLDLHESVQKEKEEIQLGLEDIRDRIAEHGTEYDCPIYGRIQHIGEDCLPYSN